jgi:muramoyltetrapeptide carboxypeptidase LdcA involved in peptidoglycan recycling
MKNIFVCAPSEPYSPGDDFPNGYEPAIRNLEKLGFNITLSKHCLNNIGNTSDTIENRIEDLMEGLTNDKYDIVLSLVGGMNANELLPHIDFSQVNNKDKILCGFSDITTMLVNFWQKSGIKAIYGPNLRQFQNIDEIAVEQFKKVINDQNDFSFADFYNRIDSKMEIIHSGSGEGTLVGGNLAVLCWLLGTPYQLIPPKDVILFVEDDSESGGQYWQMYINHLKQTGFFKNVRGLIIGKIPPEAKFWKSVTIERILREALAEYDFPIVTNAEFGHIKNQISIPYGKTIKFSV